MKEQILQLDPHDDYVSTRDKMGWVQTQRVLLVWPPRGRVLQRRLDLVLLHRHAHRLGAQLALVTRDAAVRAHADELGLPVFASVEATRRMRWRSRLPRLRPDRRAPRPDTDALRAAQFARGRRRLPPWMSLTLRVLVFALGLAALLTLASGLVPSATVTLTPARWPLTVTTELTADPDQPAVDPAAAVIPARRMRVEVQTTQLWPTTGIVDVPNANATGQVVFTNLIGTPATVPAGTSVRTTSGAPVRFVTLEPAVVEGRLGATATVAVRAVDLGPNGNVAAGQINAIDGPLGTQLAVTNVAPTQGGSVGQRAAVAQADRDALRQALEAQLTESAREAITAQLGPGELLVAETVTVTQVLAESFDHAVGEPADALGLTLRLAAAGLVISDADTRQVAEAGLRARLPPGTALTDAPLRFARAAPPTLDEAGRIRLAVTAEGTLAPDLDRDFVRRLALGQPVERAAGLIQASVPLSAAPEIALYPDWYARWFPYLPWLWLRVDVVVR